MELVDGPFSHLDGVWQFLPLNRPGTRASPGLQDRLRAELRLQQPALEAVVSPVFDRIANTFVDSFVQRAEPLRCALSWSGRRVPPTCGTAG
jgi:ribosome-associated toxin RatA of RatAB toxin-antitoxin module